jgi:hypothetical protein
MVKHRIKLTHAQRVLPDDMHADDFVANEWVQLHDFSRFPVANLVCPEVGPKARRVHESFTFPSHYGNMGTVTAMCCFFR